MPPSHQTLPAAQTMSAKEAQRSFFCELCNKGYSRMNDYDAHLGSYDHSHRQRLKDMKNMVKDPNAGARARKAEAKETGLMSIKLTGQTPGSGGSGGFKKGGFKKSGFKNAFVSVEPTSSADATSKSNKDSNVTTFMSDDPDAESNTEDEGYEVYDPRFPTD